MNQRLTNTFMSKKITCIRHCQSDFLDADPSLTQLGSQQASQINHKSDIVLISPLRRALHTYARSNIVSNKVFTSELCRERKDNLKYNYYRTEDIVPESEEDIWKRVNQLKHYILSFPEKNVCLVSHAILIWYFLSACGQTPITLNFGGSVTFEI
jgi:broad specificity phosphatase PhoE